MTSGCQGLSRQLAGYCDCLICRLYSPTTGPRSLTLLFEGFGPFQSGYRLRPWGKTRQANCQAISPYDLWLNKNAYRLESSSELQAQIYTTSKTSSTPCLPKPGAPNRPDPSPQDSQHLYRIYMGVSENRDPNIVP